MNLFLKFDQTVFTWINTDWNNPMLNAAMPWITHLGSAKAVCMVIIGLTLLKTRQLFSQTGAGSSGIKNYKSCLRSGLSFCLFLSLIYGTNSGVTNGIKYLVDRERPFEQQSVMFKVSPQTADHLSTNGSFPSGHADNAFMLAVILAACTRIKKQFYLGAAAAIAISRVYLGVHFPSDILIGALLGWKITRMMIDSLWVKKLFACNAFFLISDKNQEPKNL